MAGSRPLENRFRELTSSARGADAMVGALDQRLRETARASTDTLLVAPRRNRSHEIYRDLLRQALLCTYTSSATCSHPLSSLRDPLYFTDPNPTIAQPIPRVTGQKRCLAASPMSCLPINQSTPRCATYHLCAQRSQVGLSHGKTLADATTLCASRPVGANARTGESQPL